MGPRERIRWLRALPHMRREPPQEGPRPVERSDLGRHGRSPGARGGRSHVLPVLLRPARGRNRCCPGRRTCGSVLPRDGRSAIASGYHAGRAACTPRDLLAGCRTQNRTLDDASVESVNEGAKAVKRALYLMVAYLLGAALLGAGIGAFFGRPITFALGLVAIILGGSTMIAANELWREAKEKAIRKDGPEEAAKGPHAETRADA